ncbi:Nramp family divalent metal transporter [Taibaiella soli]|uniref:Divalent metal cation transporter MntH n=1 Tax=Taibaiella soli TaxID=1649169 RepID=A0A2W2BMB2_9BACT|nr:Nramp family divalent metal transporter [Taibaiella soli]PZF74586.1 iron/manganese transporter [Taibaiella soli]
MNSKITHTSLSDVHESIDPSKAKSKWRKIFAFFGPAYLVSVGYMDPGNWATDLAGGSQFGYKLIWVLLMSNLMAVLLQSLSARLGIVQGRDLAQCNRAIYPKGINFILYVLAEIAIAACDLAEVLGMAIGLNLLIGLPLIWGVSVTLLDTFLLLYLQRLGMRKMEAFIITLISIIGLCFLIEMFYSKPDFGDVAKGFVPSLPNSAALYIAIGIIGATVMPHNLYLHSALVQTRKIGRDVTSLKKAIKFNIIDSVLALNMAFFVNAAILILAASVFFKTEHFGVASLQDAHQLLAPLLGSKWASHLFAIALIAAGQSSTVTGTLAGQIVMEGYLRLRLNPWVRRLITRLLAIIPAVIVILWMGDKEVDSMLVFSQVLLSMQLAFAVIPLIHFVSDQKRMGQFAIGPVTKTVAWLVACVIVYLNLQLVYDAIAKWEILTSHLALKMLIWAGFAALCVLLLVTFIYPLVLRRKEHSINIHGEIIMDKLQHASPQPFKVIALALDYSEKDEQVIQYAWQLAHDDTRFVLMHIVESASAKMIGAEVKDFETVEDQKRMDQYVQLFADKGYLVNGMLGFYDRAKEIARISKDVNADLLIMGSHGHKGIKDWLLGETIDSVRHILPIPIFIAR